MITGAGPAFCAGGDVKEMSEARATGAKRSIKEKTRPGRDAALLAIHEARKPVIAAVNGAAAGAGMNLALAADIRIASTAARFSQAFVKRGLPPDTGGTYLLPRIVGLAKACELAFTGDTIDAQEALRLGVVSRVVSAEELMSVSLELATRIANGRLSLSNWPSSPSIEASRAVFVTLWPGRPPLSTSAWKQTTPRRGLPPSLRNVPQSSWAADQARPYISDDASQTIKGQVV